MQLKSVLRFGFLLLCVAGTTLGLVNTFGNKDALVPLAQKAACSKPGCTYQLRSHEHSAIQQSYSFHTELVENGRRASASADVECVREFYLLGDYRCHLVSGGLPTSKE